MQSSCFLSSCLSFSWEEHAPLRGLPEDKSSITPYRSQGGSLVGVKVKSIHRRHVRRRLVALEGEGLVGVFKALHRAPALNAPECKAFPVWEATHGARLHLQAAKHRVRGRQLGLQTLRTADPTALQAEACRVLMHNILLSLTMQPRIIYIYV